MRRLKQSSALSRPDLKYLDLDDLLLNDDARPGETLQDMIQRIGWKAFRQKEQEKLEDLVEQDPNSFILALGGGSLEQSGSWLKDRQNSGHVKLIWLDTPLQRCISQARKSGGRPLLKKTDHELSELYARRLEQYSMADISLTPDQQNELQTWEQLQVLLKK